MALSVSVALAGGAASADPAGDFILFRDVPVRNAVIPQDPGRATIVNTGPDMAVIEQVFGKDGEGITSMTDDAAAGITANTGRYIQPLGHGQIGTEGAGADQAQFAGGSMEARSGLGGSITGAVMTGLSPMMSATRMLGGKQ